MKTEQLTFSVKVNIGNYESLEVSECVYLSDGEDSDACYSKLVAHVIKKSRKAIKVLQREKEAKLFHHFASHEMPESVQLEEEIKPENNEKQTEQTSEKHNRPGTISVDEFDSWEGFKESANKSSKNDDSNSLNDLCDTLDDLVIGMETSSEISK